MTDIPATPRRGEIWLADFGEPVGHEQGLRRPAVVVSHDRLNRSRAGLIVVIPCTTTRRGLPSHVEIEPGSSGLTETSYAKGEDIRSVSTQRLIRRLGVIPTDGLARAENVIRLLLGL